MSMFALFVYNCSPVFSLHRAELLGLHLALESSGSTSFDHDHGGELKEPPLGHGPSSLATGRTEYLASCILTFFARHSSEDSLLKYWRLSTIMLLI